MKRLFWAGVSLSLGLHGALAIAWQPAPTPTTSAGNHRPAARLHGRLVVQPAADTVASRLAPPPAAVAPAEIDTGPVARTASELETPAGTPATAEAGISAETEAETAGGVAGWDHYLSRSQLTVVPSPRADILLGYPGDGPAVGRFVLTLTLYIDEAGDVRRVDVASDEALPDALRQAARSAFAGQRFSPGERAGDLVKSRIRIEVVYESLALPAFAANTTNTTNIAAAAEAAIPH